MTSTPLLELSTIPNKWEMVPLWTLFTRTKRTNFKEEELLSVYREFGVIPKSSRDDNHNVESEDLSSYQLVEVGDLVVNKMKAWQGSLALSEYRGIVSPAYFVYRFHGEGFPKYFHYLLRSAPYVALYNKISKGVRVGQWDLIPEEFRRIPVLFPPIEEQKRIVSNLDVEIANIDELIAKQKRLIGLLRERRNGLVIEASTRGVSNSRETKPSGIPWISNIPVEWEVAPLYANGQPVSQINKDGAETRLLSLSYGNIVEKRMDSNEGLLPESFNTYQIVMPNDLVFRFTDLQNDQRSLRSAIVTEKGMITSAYLAFRPEGINPQYLNYQMRAIDLMKVFYGMGSGLRQSLKYTDARRLFILIPPTKEQTEIVAYLDEKTADIDSLIARASQTIELLMERKRSAIAHAVTGFSGLGDK